MRPRIQRSFVKRFATMAIATALCLLSTNFALRADLGSTPNNLECLIRKSQPYPCKSSMKSEISGCDTVTGPATLYYCDTTNPASKDCQDSPSKSCDPTLVHLRTCGYVVDCYMDAPVIIAGYQAVCAQAYSYCPGGGGTAP